LGEQKLEMETQAGMAVLGAGAGDEATTIGVLKSQAGVFESWSPALAPKHLCRGRRQH
jgi:hypothetical protein